MSCKQQKVKLLICPSAWGPGDCAPNGEWEQRSGELHVPLIVCNRTGKDLNVVDWTGSESIVAENGNRVLSASPENSTILTFELDIESGKVVSERFHQIPIEVTI